MRSVHFCAIAVVAVSRTVLVLDVSPPEPDIIKDDVARVDLHHHVRLLQEQDKHVDLLSGLGDLHLLGRLFDFREVQAVLL